MKTDRKPEWEGGGGYELHKEQDGARQEIKVNRRAMLIASPTNYISCLFIDYLDQKIAT